MSLGALAGQTHVTAGYLSLLERGQRRAGPEVLERITEALGTTPEELQQKAVGERAHAPTATADERTDPATPRVHAPPHDRDPDAGRLHQTLGIHLSHTGINTGVCRITWSSATAEVSFPAGAGEDDALVGLIDTADITGIDAPFGWPGRFVDALVAHHSGRPWPGRSQSRYSHQTDLRLRATDRKVRQHLERTLDGEDVGPFPLSVSTDRIGVTLRMAHLQDQLGQRWDRSINRIADRIVEVYPAAALRRWQLDHRGYKPRAQTRARARIVDQLVRATGGRLLLDTAAREECQRRDHAVDALVAALVAAAVYLDRTYRPEDSSEEDTARREGWIHLPTLELEQLAQVAFPER